MMVTQAKQMHLNLRMQLLKRRSGEQQRWQRAFAVPSSEPLTMSGGPLRRMPQELTKLSCSAIFFTCMAVRAGMRCGFTRHTAASSLV